MTSEVNTGLFAAAAYFAGPGPQNTEPTVVEALSRAEALEIGHIVVASNTGATARAVLHALGEQAKVEGGRRPSVELVVVSHHVGYREPGEDEMSEETRAELREAGVRLLTTTHLFGGVERAVSRQFGGLYPGGLIANTLRLFGEGMKVAVEIAVMALDAGLIPYGRDVISIGGTGRGADTAIVIRPAHARSFFETRVVEVICRPYPRRHVSP